MEQEAEGERKLKIMFINTLYKPNEVGGAEHFVRILSEGLAGLGHEVIVLSLYPGRFPQASRSGGVRTRYIGLRNLYWPYGNETTPAPLKPLFHAADSYNPLMEKEVGRVLDVEKPDLVHTNNLSGFSVAAWNACEKRDIRTVHTLHDHYLLCPKATMFRNDGNCEDRCLQCLPYSVPRQFMSVKVNAVVGVSRYILERHTNLGFFEETPRKRVIPNPLPPASGGREGMENRANEATGSVRFGYMGQLTPAKGVETLLRAAARLPEDGWTLRVAGRGSIEYEDHLESTYSSHSCSFVGFVSPERFLRTLDVLVIPSRLRESFGRGVIEAHSQGVAVLASDRGGLRDLIEPGKTGYYFDPDDTAELEESMLSMINDPRKLYAMRGDCIRAASAYSHGNVIEKYLDLYSAVAPQGSRKGISW